MNIKEIINCTDPILLVEDEPDHARLVIKSIKEHGRLLNDIVWLRNGEEAIQYITGAPPFHQNNTPRPCLVLLDLKLPLKDGFQVLEVIRGNPLYKTTPVVMLTAMALSEDVNRALQLGANDYIVKPVRFAEFVDKISHMGYYWAMISDSHQGAPVRAHDGCWSAPPS